MMCSRPSFLIYMSHESVESEKEGRPLLRRFGLLQAIALNMSNMLGVGPFITIPLLMSALGGPQAMVGWLVAVLIAIPDGMVWSELGAAMPGSGGSYVYLREAYGRETFGRLMAFLFIWQFILSGPLEIASGYIGFARYTGYVWPGITAGQTLLVAAAVGIVNIVFLYRRITSIGTITVSLWIGTLLTTLAVIVTGAMHFSAARAFDFPPGAFNFSLGFLFGLGAASRIGVYDYLGYYDICYIGDEVKEPGRTIPRSIIISVVAVAIIYFAINLSIIGVVPWREFVPFDAHPQSGFVVSLMMEKSTERRSRLSSPPWCSDRIRFGLRATAWLFTNTLCRRAGRLLLQSVWAAASDKEISYVALIVLGVISIICSFFSLDKVIDALISTWILVQFIGQVFALILLRRRAPDMPRPYRMWLYPLPSIIALVGWIFIFATTPWPVIVLGLGMLTLGAGVFLAWSWRSASWPLLQLALMLQLDAFAVNHMLRKSSV